MRETTIVEAFQELKNINKRPLKESVELDEKAPNDYMKSLRRDNRHGKNSFNEPTSKYHTTDWNDKPVDPFTNIIDYENSDYKEITADEVKRMKKAGEDLSNVIVMKDGKHISLYPDGSPYNAEDRNIRANQSLTKTLDGADKIYLANEKDLADTQPEKAKQRLSDEEERRANLNLGHNRPEHYWDEKKEIRKDAYKSITNMNGNKSEIADAKQAFEDGDISRKEMEKRIEDAKNTSGNYFQHDVDRDTQYRNRKANALNYASNKAAQKNIETLKDARDEIMDSTRAMNRAKSDLINIKNDSNDGWTNSDYLYAKKKVDELTRQIKILQDDLAHYQKTVDKGNSKEIEDLEQKIKQEEERLQKSRETIDNLLKRNK